MRAEEDSLDHGVNVFFIVIHSNLVRIHIKIVF
jgi:hypothetical protein